MFYLCFLCYSRELSSLPSIFSLLMLFYRLEAIARICVSGFLLDPDVPVSSIFTSIFSSSSYNPEPLPQPPRPLLLGASSSSLSLPTNTTLGHQAPSPLARGLTIKQRLGRVRSNLLRPFVLPTASSATPSYRGGGPSSATLVGAGRTRSDTLTLNEKSSSDPSHSNRPPFLANSASHLSNSDYTTQQQSSSTSISTTSLSLPFRLSINQAHSKTQRNVPYLRHSWSRIDFVAIVSFWISFGLASGGLERGGSGEKVWHIGIFRAMSVLRTARLLTVTSGTTVSGFFLLACLGGAVF
jgi:voltage-dependent calcium channel